MPNHGMGLKTRQRRRKQLLKAQQCRCADCRRPFTAVLFPTIEHKTPVRDGGNNTLSNLELICEPCRRRRNTPTDSPSG